MNAVWSSYLKGYRTWLRLERGLSENTLDAYLGDVSKLATFTEGELSLHSPLRVDTQVLRAFLAHLASSGISERSQARTLSSLRSFFTYLGLEDKDFINPAEGVDAPRLGRYLPEVLSAVEVERILTAIDRSKPNGERNKAIIELLFACGLRVSELVNLRFSDLFLKHEVIRVRGKGNKERLIPIGRPAREQLTLYIEQVRVHIKASGDDDIVFLNRRGGRLSRQMIFIIVRQLAREAGIQKKIGPHTFRHSFATVLVNKDANLRAVQEMLGHESVTTTEIYTHLSREKLDEALLSHHPRAKRKAKPKD